MSYCFCSQGHDWVHLGAIRAVHQTQRGQASRPHGKRQGKSSIKWHSTPCVYEESQNEMKRNEDEKESVTWKRKRKWKTENENEHDNEHERDNEIGNGIGNDDDDDDDDDTKEKKRKETIFCVLTSGCAKKTQSVRNIVWIADVAYSHFLALLVRGSKCGYICSTGLIKY